MAVLGTKFSELFKRRGKEAAAKRSAPAAIVVHGLMGDASRRKAEHLPRFQSTANDQSSTWSGDRINLMRSRVRHAFTPSQPIADRKMFAGREAALRTLISSIEDQRLHAVLYGERGIGKTSMLHMLTQAAGEARYIVVYTSCGANSNFDDTFRAVATNIPILFHSGFSPTAEQAEKGATLADLLPSGPLTPRQFSELCSKLTGTRVLVVLDEFDRCESTAFRRDIAELIKNLSDRLVRVQLVLAGVAADLTELVTHIPSIRRNIFAMRLSRMSDEEVQKVISNGEREIGFTFDTAASELIIGVSRGSPYVANLLCHHASQSALNDSRIVVSVSDVAYAVEQVYMEFRVRIGKPVTMRVKILIDRGHGADLDWAAHAALSAEGPIGVQDLLRYSDYDAKSAEKLLVSLSEAGILTATDEDDAGKLYDFVEETLPTYLWLSSTRANFRPEEPKAKAAVRS